MTGYRPVIFTIPPPFLEQRALVLVGDGVVAAEVAAEGLAFSHGLTSLTS